MQSIPDDNNRNPYTIRVCKCSGIAHHLLANMTTPDTKVLAIASHVVYGYVGNSVATFVLQSLGLDVASLNTVNFSNHTGYGQWKGTKVSAQEILDLYEGLKDSHIDDFDMLLTGYIPGAEGVETVGSIAKEMKLSCKPANGRFFWVLDPVMGDQGHLYVSENVVPVYKSLLPYADLITPNQFEAEILSGITIKHPSDLKTAVSAIHSKYGTPHVMISSSDVAGREGELVLAGSSVKSDGTPRHFMVAFPKILGYFTGTGDMFASLSVARFREQAILAGLIGEKSWMSPDDVPATELPLARTAELALGTMYQVLARTGDHRDKVIREKGISVDPQDAKEKMVYMKAAELRLVQCWDVIRQPEVRYRAEEH